MQKYILLKNLKVTEAAIHSGFYSAGVPAMTAVAGMGHALGLRISEHLEVTGNESDDFDFDAPEADYFHVTGVTPVIAAYAASPGPARRVNYEHGSKKGLAASDAFDPLADMVVDLIIRINSTLSNLQLKALFSKKEVLACVHRLRFAGGTIFWDGVVEISENFALLLDECSVTSILIEDATAKVVEYMASNLASSIVDIYDQLTSRREAKVITEEQLPYEPRYLTLGVGYRALEAVARQQPLLSSEEPHLFVEPVLGLARARLVASVKKSLANEENAFVVWAHKMPENGYYLTAGEQP